jgi:hypothetical protein
MSRGTSAVRTRLLGLLVLAYYFNLEPSRGSTIVGSRGLSIVTPGAGGGAPGRRRARVLPGTPSRRKPASEPHSGWQAAHWQPRAEAASQAR